MDWVAARLAGLDYRSLSQAEITYRRPGATIAYALASAEADWVKLATAGISFDKVIHHFRDEITAQDAVSLTITKPFADSIATDDAVSITLYKAANDDIVVADGVSISFEKSIADTIAVADAIGLTVHKLFSDTVSTVDDVLAFRGEYVSEGVSVEDSVSIATVFAVTPLSQPNGYALGEFTLGG